MLNYDYTLLVTDEDLYLHNGKEPYDEGFISKIHPTNICYTVKFVPTPPVQSVTLPNEILETILFDVALYKFKCRKYQDVFKILLLRPKLFVNFYLHFFPKEQNTYYQIYFDSHLPIYKDRISRMLFFMFKIHQVLCIPSHECPAPYFLIEIIVSDNHALYPILPWTVVEGRHPKDYNIEISVLPNEFPDDSESHFAYITGPVIGDIAWIKGFFYSNNILLAKSIHRPVIPIIFTGQYEGLYKGETILLRESAWRFFTHMFQYIYGEDTRMYVGDSISDFDYKFYDTLDPRFLL